MIGVFLSIPLTFYITRKVKGFAPGLLLSYFAGMLAGGMTSLFNVFLSSGGKGYYDGVAFVDLFVQMLAHPIAAIIFFLFWVARKKQHEADMENAYWVCSGCEAHNHISLEVCEQCGKGRLEQTE